MWYWNLVVKVHIPLNPNSLEILSEGELDCLCGVSLQRTDESQVLGSGCLAYTVTWSSLVFCVHCPMICRISAILRNINFISKIKTSKEEDFSYILWRRKCIMTQSFLLNWNSNEAQVLKSLFLNISSMKKKFCILEKLKQCMASIRVSYTSVIQESSSK